jgi:carbamoyltransferase
MNILGIWDGHNSSACVIAQYVAASAVSEERLSRRKMQRGFPFNSISSVLKIARISPADIDMVAVAGRSGRGIIRIFNDSYSSLEPGAGPLELPARIHRHYENLSAKVPFLRSIDALASSASVLKRLKASGLKNKVPLVFVSHHYAHAASAAMMCKGDCLIFTMDGYGDGCWATTWIKGRKGISLLREYSYLYSPAVTYGSVTQILGFKEGEEGKVTAMAASGNPEPLSGFFFQKFKNCFGSGSLLAGPISSAEKQHLLKFKPEDIAAGIQNELEKRVASYVEQTFKRHPETDICLAGGLFANVSLNRRIVETCKDASIHVFPAMGDEGLSLGAASFVMAQKTGRFPEFQKPYLGMEIEDSLIPGICKKHDLKFIESSSPEQGIAHLIAQGRTVAIVRDREEYGPRALGNRSLLFNATDLNLMNRVQKMLDRDKIMPFAPVCRDINVEEFFAPPFPCADAKDKGLGLMTFAVKTRARTVSAYPAAVHLDGTSRVQVVTEDSNLFLYRILEEYEKISEHKLLINTSFNLHREPVVHSVQDAISTFMNSGIDCMLIGKYLIENEFERTLCAACSPRPNSGILTFV